MIYGGVKQVRQVERLQAGVDILIATPGRLNDLIGQGFVKLDKIEIFVLDEADRMLDMGFINDIRRILHSIPRNRQSLFFSATMPPDVEKLAMTILRDPSTVKVDPVTSTVDSIKQSLYYVDKANKSKLLASLVKGPDVRSALVFTRTKHGADKVARDLARSEILRLPFTATKARTRGRMRSTASCRETSGFWSPRTSPPRPRYRGAFPCFQLRHSGGPGNLYPSHRTHGARRPFRRRGQLCCYDELERLFAVEKLIGKQIPVTDSPYPMEVCTYSAEPQRTPRPSRGQEQPRRRQGKRW